MEKPRKKRYSIGLAFLLSAVCAFAQASWVGTGTVGTPATWSTSGNWTGTVPTNSSTISTLTFLNSAANSFSNNDLTGLTVGAISIPATDGATSIKDNTVSGNAFTLTGNFTVSTANSQNFNIGINLSGNRTFTVNSGQLTLGGVLADSGGAGSFTKAGANSVILTAANTYTGTTTISAGTLQLGNGGTTGSLSTSSAITNNGTFTINRSNTVTQGTDFASTFSGTGLLRKSGTGNLILSGANTLGSTDALTFSGSNSGTVTLTNTAALGAAGNTVRFSGGGSGTLDLQTNTSVNAYNLGSGSGNGGTLIVNRATPGVGITHTLGFAELSSVTLNANTGSNVTSGNAGISLTEVRMSGGNDNSPVTLGGSALFTVGTASININGFSKRLQLDGTNAGNTIGLIADTNFAASGALVNLIKANSSTWTLTAANTYSGTTTISGGTLQLGNGGTTGSLNSSSAITNNGTFAINRSNTVTQGTDFASTFSGTGVLVKSGTGNLILSGANTLGSTNALTFSGSNSGTVTLTNTAALGVAGNTVQFTGGGSGVLDLQTNTSVNAYNLGSGNGNGGTLIINRATAGAGFTHTLGLVELSSVTLTANTGSNVTSGTARVSFTEVRMGGGNDGSPVTLAGSAAYTIGTASINNNGFSKRLQLDGTNAGNTIGLIADTNYAVSGALVNLIKANTSTWTLTGANTYTGITTVSGGVLNLQTSTALGSTAAGTTVASGAELQLQGNISVGAEALTISGTGVASGGALRNISGTNTYGGLLTLGAATRINSDAGTLTLSNTGTLTGATFGLTVGGAGNTTIASILGTTSGSLTKDGSGTLTLNGNNTYTGGTNLAAGTVNFTTGGLGASGAVTFTGTSALQYGAATTTDLSSRLVFSNGVIGTIDTGANNVTFATGFGASGSGALTKAGSGTLTLSGSNSYSGATTVSEGTLIVANNSALGTSAVNVSSLGLLQLSGVTVTGQTLALTGNGTNNISLQMIAGANAWTGDLTINPAATTRIAANSGTSLNLAGNIALSSTTTDQLVFQGVGSISVGGAISGASIVTRSSTGNGTLSLSGANTYTGKTNINGGTLFASSLNSVTTDAGLGTTHATSSNLGAPVTVANGTLGLGSSVNTGTLAYTGSGETTDRVLNLTGTTGGGSLDQSGTGLLKFTSALTATGLGAKTLTLQGSTAGSGELAGAIVDSSGGATSLTKAGTGTWTLSAANTYTGLTTVNAGTLAVGSSGSLASGNDLTLGASGTADFANAGQTLGAVSNANATSNALNFSAASGTVTLASLSGSGNTTFGSNANIGTLSGGTVNLGSSSALTVSDGTSAGSITGTGGSLTKTSAGTLTLSGANSYTGTTTVSAGVLNIQNATALGTTAGGTSVASGAALQVQGDISVGAEALTLGGTGVANDGALRNISGTNTYGGLVTLGAASRINSDAGTLTLSNVGTITGSGFDLTLGGAGNMTVTSIIGTGSGNLIKDGAGIVTLSGANTFSGTTTINAGTLRLGVINALDSTSAIILANAAGVVLDLNGFNVSFGSLSGGGNLGGTVSLGSTTLTTGGDNTSTSYASNLSGGGGITKTGTGVFTLTGTNSYTGATTVSGGTLQAGSTTAFGNGSAVTLANTSGVVLDLNNNNITVGSLAGGGSTGGNVTLGSGTLTAGDDNTNTSFGGVIGGTGGLTKSGSGTLTFNAANTYTGLTTVSTGTFAIGSSGSLASGNDLTLGASGLATFANAGQTLGVVSNANTATNALNFSASTGTVTLASLSGLGNTRFGNDGVVTGGISAGTVTSIGNLTANISGGTTTVGGLLTGNISAGTVGADSLSATTVSGGTTTITGTAGITTFSSGATTVGGVATIGTLSGGIANLNGATSAITTLNGGTVNLGSGTTLSVSDGTSAGVIAGTGGSLIKTSSGTLTLIGANTYTGLTTVSAGTLAIGSSGSLASGNALTLGASGAADFANAGQTLGAVANANTATSALNFSGATGTVTLASLSGVGNTRFGSDGVVTGSISAGTVTSVGNLTANISGGTTSVGGLLTGNISAGTVGAGSLSATTVSGGTNTITGAAGITTLSGGTTTVGGVATIGTLSGGIANFNGATSTITTLNGGTVNLAASTALSVSGGTSAGVIAGVGGSLTKTGSGALTLTGANTYTGATTVSAGTLTLHAASGAALANTSSLTLAGGGTLALSAANQLNSTATLNLNGGTLALNGFNQTLGTLDLNTASALNLSGSAALVFADSSGLNWDSAYLAVSNFVVGTNSLRFGSTNSGLTATQLGLLQFIEFGNSSARIDADGFIAPLSTNYLNSGSATIDIATSITGTTTVDQTGTGSTTLTGSNTSTGTATVSNGTLVIGTAAGGTWAGNVTVGGNGILKGRGTIGGDVVINTDGIYSPGNSPAIQNVGSLTVNSGGFVMLELDGASAGNGVGFHDQIISAGAVTLSGGTLTAQTVFSGSSGYLPTIGAVHAVITGSSITGTFAAYDFASAALPEGVTFLPEYTATSVNLYAVPSNYATTVADLNANQTQVGAALQSLRNSGLPFELDQRTTLDARSTLFNGLKTKDAAGLRTAYDELTPEKLTALAATTFQSASFLNSSLQQRSAELRRFGPASVSLNGVVTPAAAKDYRVETVIEDGVHYQIAKAKPKKHYGYFAAATGAFAAVDGSSDRFGSFSQTGTASAGVDYALNETQSVGLVVSQAYADTDFSSASGSARTTTSRVGLFHDYHNNGFFVNTSVSAGFSAYDSKRKIAFLNQTAGGETQGFSYGGHLSTGYDFKVGEFIMGPTASLAYDHAHIDGFDETGSAADLQVRRQKADSVVTQLGFHLSRPVVWQRIGWIPDVRLGVSRQHYNPESIQARFAAGGSDFKVNPQAGGSEYVNPGASLSALLPNGWTVRLSYDAILNPQYAEHRINLSLNTGF